MSVFPDADTNTEHHKRPVCSEEEFLKTTTPLCQIHETRRARLQVGAITQK